MYTILVLVSLSVAEAAGLLSDKSSKCIWHVCVGQLLLFLLLKRHSS